MISYGFPRLFLVSDSQHVASKSTTQKYVYFFEALDIYIYTFFSLVFGSDDDLNFLFGFESAIR
jgi:hypothetical protein